MSSASCLSFGEHSSPPSTKRGAATRRNARQDYELQLPRTETETSPGRVSLVCLITRSIQYEYRVLSDVSSEDVRSLWHRVNTGSVLQPIAKYLVHQPRPEIIPLFRVSHWSLFEDFVTPSITRRIRSLALISSANVVHTVIQRASSDTTGRLRGKKEEEEEEKEKHSIRRNANDCVATHRRRRGTGSAPGTKRTNSPREVEELAARDDAALSRVPRGEERVCLTPRWWWQEGGICARPRETEGRTTR